MYWFEKITPKNASLLFKKGNPMHDLSYTKTNAADIRMIIN